MWSGSPSGTFPLCAKETSTYIARCILSSIISTRFSACSERKDGAQYEVSGRGGRVWVVQYAVSGNAGRQCPAVRPPKEQKRKRQFRKHIWVSIFFVVLILMLAIMVLSINRPICSSNG